MTNDYSIDPVFFTSADEFEDWLEQHGAEASELLVGFRKRASGLPSLTWPESVGAALCFGWIDGQVRTHDEKTFVRKFTPRRSSQSSIARTGTRYCGESKRQRIPRCAPNASQESSRC